MRLSDTSRNEFCTVFWYVASASSNCAWASFRLPRKRAAGEQRHRDRRAELPRLRRRGEQVGQRHGLVAVEAGERHLGEERGLGLADVGVGGDELLFRGADVRPALEQVGRQARRHRQRRASGRRKPSPRWSGPGLRPSRMLSSFSCCSMRRWMSAMARLGAVTTRICAWCDVLHRGHAAFLARLRSGPANWCAPVGALGNLQFVVQFQQARGRPWPPGPPASGARSAARPRWRAAGRGRPRWRGGCCPRDPLRRPPWRRRRRRTPAAGSRRPERAKGRSRRRGVVTSRRRR